jgi:hypothetical protein
MIFTSSWLFPLGGLKKKDTATITLNQGLEPLGNAKANGALCKQNKEHRAFHTFPKRFFSFD